MSEYNIYDIEACQAAIVKIEAINTNVAKKSGHAAKLQELRDAVEGLRTINYHLFDSECYAPYYRYKEVFDRGEKKTRLDDFLRFAVRDIIKDLATTKNPYQNRTEYDIIES